jgi:hypothetical protein
VLFFIISIFISCNKNNNEKNEFSGQSNNTAGNIENSIVYENTEQLNVVQTDKIKYLSDKLWTDIKNNYNDWGDGFYVFENPSDTPYYMPDPRPWEYDRVVVRNETIEIQYYKYDYLMPQKYGQFTGEFLPMGVVIFNNTDGYFLGNYIGKQISEVENIFSIPLKKDTTFDIAQLNINNNPPPGIVTYTCVFREKGSMIYFRTINDIIERVVYTFFY